MLSTSAPIIVSIIVVLMLLLTYSLTVSEQFNVNRFGKCKNEVIDSWSPVAPCQAVTDELGKVIKYVVPSNFVIYKMSNDRTNKNRVKWSIVAPESAEYHNFNVMPIASADSKLYTSADAVLQGLYSVEPINEIPFVMDTDKRFYLDSRKEFCKVSKDNASMGCAGQVRRKYRRTDNQTERFDNVYKKEYINALKPFEMPLTFHNDNTTSFYPIYSFAPMGTNTVTGDSYYLGFPNDDPDGMSFIPYLKK
jgi:hypothetical protein